LNFLSLLTSGIFSVMACAMMILSVGSLWSNYLITARISRILPIPFGWASSHSPALDSFLGFAGFAGLVFGFLPLFAPVLAISCPFLFMV
jgi:hypothetical protein